MRTRYWSCSSFANWIRGVSKPRALTAEQWNEWNNESKSKYPIRYWIAEEFLDSLQRVIYSPIDFIYSIKYYINNRWVSGSHCLTANKRDIPRGQWQDVGYRFLPCLFNELQNYVEIELAWSNIAWDDKAYAKFNPPFWAKGWFRWRTWRCPEAGLEHLNWSASLIYDEEWIEKDDPKYGTPTPQAINALEIIALYKWWTEVYRNRPDPSDVSGWSEICARRGENGTLFLSDKTEEEKAESRKALVMMDELEKQYEEEDTEMMCRLIKIRNSLWT